MANWGNSFAQGFSDGWKFGSMYRDRKREDELTDFAKEQQAGIGKQDVSDRVNAYEAEINRQDDETFGAGTSKEMGLPTNDRHFIDPKARPDHVAAGPVYDRRQYYNDLSAKATGLGMLDRGEKYMDRAIAEEDRALAMEDRADRKQMFRLQLAGAEREENKQKIIESILRQSRAMYDDIESGDPNAVMNLVTQAVDFYNSDVTDGRTAKLVMGKNGGFVAEIYDDKTGKKIDSQPLTSTYLKSVVGQWQDYQLRNADVSLGLKLRDREDRLGQQNWERAFAERGMGLKERALASDERYKQAMLGVYRARANDNPGDFQREIFNNYFAAVKEQNPEMSDAQARVQAYKLMRDDYSQRDVAPAKPMSPKDRLEFEQMLTSEVSAMYPGLKGQALAIKVQEEAERRINGVMKDPYADITAPPGVGPRSAGIPQPKRGADVRGLTGAPSMEAVRNGAVDTWIANGLDVSGYLNELASSGLPASARMELKRRYPQYFE